MITRPPTATLFPYTTLFRSRSALLHPGTRGARTQLPPGASCSQGGWRRERPSSPLRRRHRAAQSSSGPRSEEHTSELQSQFHLVCRLLLEKKKKETSYYPLR